MTGFDFILNDAVPSNNVEQVAQIPMEPEIKVYRLKFNKTLEPIKVMLMNRKQQLTRSEWLSFVESTEKSVIRNPDQYLGKELPVRETMVTIVERIFDEFLEHQS